MKALTQPQRKGSFYPRSDIDTHPQPSRDVAFRVAGSGVYGITRVGVIEQKYITKVDSVLGHLK